MITRRAALSAAAFSAASSLVRPAAAASSLTWKTLAAHYYMPPCFAADHDLFARHGLPPVEVGISTAPPTLLPAVIAGAIQVGVSTCIGVAMARDNGLDVKLLAGASIQEHGHPNTAILAAPDSTLSKPADFVGKRVVIPGVNGSFHVMFQKWMLDGGQDPKSVTYLEAGFAQAGDYLRNRSADAVLSTEPFMSRMLQAGIARRVADYFDPAEPLVFDSVFIVQGAWAAANPKLIAGLRATLNDALGRMRADPAAAIATEVKWLHVPTEVAAGSVPASPRCDITAADVQRWLDVAAQVGLISKKPPAASLIA